MKNIIFLAIITIFVSCNANNKPQGVEVQPVDKQIVHIDSFLMKLDTEQTFMGSVSITKNGKEVYTKAMGERDLEKGLKINTHTKYRIGSITKTFTAALVFKAIEENKIQLNQTIEQFFPTLLKGNKITIAHLLHHQSGIQSYTKDSYFWENRTQKLSEEDLMNAMSKLKRNFEPGENTQYSNSNYFLLAQLLEIVYERSFEDLLVDRIIKPLNLQNTIFNETIHAGNNESYSYTFEEGQWKLFPETHLSLAKGSGSLISTPSDLNIFFRSLLKGELISSSSLKEMTTIVRSHGMGIFELSLHDQLGLGHGGNIDGFTAKAFYFKDIDLALSVTSNASVKPMNEVYSEILKLFLGEQEIAISEDELVKYVGVYASEKNPTDKVVFEREGNTLIHVIMNEFREPLTYKGNRRFLFNQVSAPQISFSFSENGNELIFEQNKFKEVYKRE